LPVSAYSALNWIIDIKLPSLTLVVAAGIAADFDRKIHFTVAVYLCYPGITVPALIKTIVIFYY
jgi:hypothetical protein